MHRFLLLLMIVAVASGVSTEATAEDLTFQSATYSNFRQMFILGSEKIGEDSPPQLKTSTN